MPTINQALVRYVLANRKKINNNEEMLRYSKLLFELALKDKEAATELLKIPNRFVQLLIYAGIKDQKFLDFASLYPDLTDKLIASAKIGQYLAIKMRAQKLKVRDLLEIPLIQLKILAKSEESYADAEEPYDQPQKVNGRTKLIIKNKDVERGADGHYYLHIKEEKLPIVTRFTRDFTKKLYSVGASNKREHIELNPDSPVLKTVYDGIKAQIKPGMTTPEILALIAKNSRLLFSSTEVDHFIKQQLASGNKVIGLDQFILNGIGVCRHHTLLNAYILSRLVKDDYLKGEVIHHRQDFTRGAHTWNLFIDKNNKPEKLYSLDSLWNDISCVTDKPGHLDKLYDTEVESVIAKRFPIKSPHKEGNEVVKPDYRAIIKNIKKHIETIEFPVGDYLFFKGGVKVRINDSDKVLPHRVAEIYRKIVEAEKEVSKPSPEALIMEIQNIAEIAVQAPKTGRKKSTTDFYKEIIKNLKEQDSNSNDNAPTMK